MSYVYILESLKDGRYYIGSTSNLSERLKHHFGGSTPTTKRFGELRLIFSQKYNTLKEARYIEKRLKRLKRKDFLLKIVKDRMIKIMPE